MMNKISLDILTTSSHYVYKKRKGTRKKNLWFDIGDKRVKASDLDKENKCV